MHEYEYNQSEEYIKHLVDQNGKCNLGRFTSINNALREESELGEIIVATGKPETIDVITFSPERLALLYTVAITQTEAQLYNEEHLTASVDYLYKSKVLPSIKKFTNEEFPAIIDQIEQNVTLALQRFKNKNLDKNNPIDQLVYKTYMHIQDRIERGLYRPGHYNPQDDITSVVSKVVFDELYRESINKKVNEITEKAINQAIEQQEVITDKKSVSRTLTKLPVHEGADRLTFMIAGPPACGKGGISKMIEIDARKSGIEFHDVVKINTDFYRKIVASNQPLGNNQYMHAALNNDEASYITKLTINRLEEKIKQNAAPHVLLDTVNIRQAKIDFGTANKGTMQIKVITLDPAIAVERAIKRGQRMGRYVPMQYMLASHQGTGRGLADIITRNKGRNIKIEVYENNVSKTELPALVQSIDLDKGQIKIHDHNKYGEIYGRQYINVSADSIYTIYPFDMSRQDFS